VATGADLRTLDLSPDAVGAMVDGIRADRAAAGRAAEPFDVGLFAVSERGQASLVRAYGAAGVTWWLESLSPLRGSHEALLARVLAGPAR
jgi:hypothetical protein